MFPFCRSRFRCELSLCTARRRSIFIWTSASDSLAFFLVADALGKSTDGADAVVRSNNGFSGCVEGFSGDEPVVVGAPSFFIIHSVTATDATAGAAAATGMAVA
jgi:hypothetical protein